jgi:hypothetical protein
MYLELTVRLAVGNNNLSPMDKYEDWGASWWAQYFKHETIILRPTFEPNKANQVIEARLKASADVRRNAEDRIAEMTGRKKLTLAEARIYATCLVIRASIDRANEIALLPTSPKLYNRGANVCKAYVLMHVIPAEVYLAVGNSL